MHTEQVIYNIISEREIISNITSYKHISMYIYIDISYTYYTYNHIKYKYIHIYIYKHYTSLYIYLVTFVSKVNTIPSHIWYISLVLRFIKKHIYTYIHTYIHTLYFFSFNIHAQVYLSHLGISL